MLTPKQSSLLHDLHKQYLSSANIKGHSIESFVKIACGKTYFEMTGKDLTTVIQFVKEHTLISGAQKDYIQKVLIHCSDTPNKYVSDCLGKEIVDIETFVNVMNNHEFSLIMKHIRQEGTVYIPLKIHKEVYMYKVLQQSDEHGYAIVQQKHVAKDRHMKLMSFKNLMICDWDNMSIEDVQDLLLQYPEDTFMIYQTTNGYHGYCVSRPLFHDDFDTLQMMYKLKCDTTYISFTKVNGFMVRLEKKHGRDEPYVERYVKQIGHGQINLKLMMLVELKDIMIKN